MSRQSNSRVSGMVAIGELDNITIASENGRLRDLAKIQNTIEALPLLLPQKGEYLLEKKADGFHVYGARSGISQYALGSPLGPISQISSKDGDLKLEFSHEGEIYSLTVHADPYHSAREGYFRPSQLHSARAAEESRTYGSESGSGKTGER